MLTIRVDKETKEMLAYLRLHKVKFTPKLREVMKNELSQFCNEFKRKESRIKDAPDWLYE